VIRDSLRIAGISECRVHLADIGIFLWVSRIFPRMDPLECTKSNKKADSHAKQSFEKLSNLDPVSLVSGSVDLRRAMVNAFSTQNGRQTSDPGHNQSLHLMLG
jgi:hypothetical protein